MGPAKVLPGVPLHFYVWWVVVLAVVGVGIGFIARYYLFLTAYAIEFDLRNIVYEHLRDVVPVLRPGPVGQLISRANSDIRSSRCT